MGRVFSCKGPRSYQWLHTSVRAPTSSEMGHPNQKWQILLVQQIGGMLSTPSRPSRRRTRWGQGVRHERADEVVPKGDLLVRRARAAPDPNLRAQHPALRRWHLAAVRQCRRPCPRPARSAFVRDRGRDGRLLRATARAHDLLVLGELGGRIREVDVRGHEQVHRIDAHGCMPTVR